MREEHHLAMMQTEPDRWVREGEGAGLVCASLFALVPGKKFYITDSRRGPRDNHTDGETDVIYSFGVIDLGCPSETLGEIRVNANCWSFQLTKCETYDAVKKFVHELWEEVAFEGYHDQLCR